MLERAFTATYVVPTIVFIFGGKCEVIKHSDTFTKGIPDLTVTGDRQTFWIESKVIRKGGPATLEGVIKARKQGLQHLTLGRLARFSEGRAFYIVRDEIRKSIYWTDPDDLFAKNDEVSLSRPMAAAYDCLSQVFRCKSH